MIEGGELRAESDLNELESEKEWKKEHANDGVKGREAR